MASKKRIILDVDTGIDDALAILYLLKHPDVKVEGITTGYGNVSVEQATLNTLKIIELSAIEDTITVAMGANRPLYRVWNGPVTHVHGMNGIGDVSLPDPTGVKTTENASDFIVRIVNENVGDISLVFVGRLTNLAIALAKDPLLPKKVKELVIMGGAIKVPGNVTPVSEANIAGDPEAAHMVFQAGFSLTMVGLDVTMEAAFSENHVAVLMENATDKNQEMVKAIADMLDFRFKAYKGLKNEKRQCPLHDVLAAAVCVDRSLVDTEDMFVEIETKGKVSVGATITDLRLIPKTETNTAVCISVNKEKFIKTFIDVLSGNSKEVLR